LGEAGHDIEAEERAEMMMQMRQALEDFEAGIGLPPIGEY
jgi:hypothetical protein